MLSTVRVLLTAACIVSGLQGALSATETAKPVAGSDTTSLLSRFFGPTDPAPTAADSLFDPRLFTTRSMINADRVDMAGPVIPHPLLIDAPASLDDYPHRSLRFGHPALVADRPDNAPLATILNAVATPLSPDLHTAGGTAITSDGHLSPIAYTAAQKPSLLFLWENGGAGGKLFGHNALAVRFNRPLSDKLDLAVSTTYRHTNHATFDHGTGNIVDLYKGIYDGLGVDSNRLSTTGTNPLTDEQTLTISLRRVASKRGTISATYSYDDRDNEYFMQGIDTTGTLLDRIALWSSYTHHIHAAASIRPDSGRIAARAGFTFANGVVRQTLLHQEAFASSLSRGAGQGFDCTMGLGFVARENDSIGIEGSIGRQKLSLFSDNADTLTTGAAGLFLTGSRTTGTGDLHLSLDLRGGLRSLASRSEDTLALAPYLRANLTADIRKFRGGVFGTLDRMTPVVSLANDSVYAARATDEYLSTGIIAGITLPVFTCDAAWALFYGIDSATTADIWAPLPVPYTAPHQAFILHPVLGRYGSPIILTSSTHFSDEKPYIKSKTDLLIDIPRGDGTRHLGFDLGFNYWSERDSVTFGNTRSFAEPIYDVSLKTSMQIRSFRLFYSVENLLNRRIFYVPGQELPGLIFKWGFNWQLLN